MPPSLKEEKKKNEGLCDKLGRAYSTLSLGTPEPEVLASRQVLHTGGGRDACSGAS